MEEADIRYSKERLKDRKVTGLLGGELNSFYRNDSLFGRPPHREEPLLVPRLSSNELAGQPPQLEILSIPDSHFERTFRPSPDLEWETSM